MLRDNRHAAVIVEDIESGRSSSLGSVKWGTDAPGDECTFDAQARLPAHHLWSATPCPLTCYAVPRCSTDSFLPEQALCCCFGSTMLFQPLSVRRHSNFPKAGSITAIGFRAALPRGFFRRLALSTPTLRSQQCLLGCGRPTSYSNRHHRELSRNAASALRTESRNEGMARSRANVDLATGRSSPSFRRFARPALIQLGEPAYGDSRMRRGAAFAPITHLRNFRDIRQCRAFGEEDRPE